MLSSSSTPRREASLASITSSSTASGSGSGSNGKKGFFNKILRRRAGLNPSSIRSTSTKVASIDEATSPLTKKSKTGKLSRSGSLKKTISSRRHSLDFVDDETSSIFDYDNDDMRGSFQYGDELSPSSSITNSLSDESLKATRLFTNFENHDHDEKVNFDELLGSDTDEKEEPFWLGLTYESLVTPKYTRINRRNKHSPRTFGNLFLAQELNVDCKNYDSPNDSDSEVHSDSEDEGTASTADFDGASLNKSNQCEIFVMEFSSDGKYLAVAGRDSVVKIWKVISSPLSRLETKHINPEFDTKPRRKERDKVFKSAPVFHQEPVRVFEGHTKSILSLDWSKNNFLVTGSMDRTVKLWHVDRPDCLQTFQHEDFVTSVKFHPTDDRFFLSGSLDNEVRLWSILEKSIAYSKHLGDEVLVTALSFTPDGQYCMAGGFNGSVFVLETNGLHQLKKFEVKESSIVAPFHNKNGNKITGIKIFENPNINKVQSVLSELLNKWNVLITTNDSKVRLINSDLKKLVTRFKGLANTSSSIIASMSDDHHYIISGSEDHWCYIWENNNYIINNKLRQALKDLLLEGKHHINDLHKKHKVYGKFIQENKLLKKLNIKQFLEENQSDFEYVSNENSSYTAFHAHHSKVNAALFAPESTKRLLEFSDDIIYDLVRRGKKLEQEDPSKAVFTPEDDRLGHIIVTTDQYGLIRVFRQDSAYKTRKTLIDYRKSAKCPVSSSKVLSKQLSDNICLPPNPESKISNNKTNLRMELSNLNRKVHCKSSSPAAERHHSLKDKIHNKLKRNGSRSNRRRNSTSYNDSSIYSPSTSPVGNRTVNDSTNNALTAPKMVPSSSMININDVNARPRSPQVFGDSALHVDFHNGSDIENSSVDSFLKTSSKLPSPTGAKEPIIPSTSAKDTSIYTSTPPAGPSRTPSYRPPLIVNTSTTEGPNGQSVDNSEIINFKTPSSDLKGDDVLIEQLKNTKFESASTRGRKI